MYSISQLVIIVSIPDEPFTTLCDYCFQHFLMKFGLYKLIIIDDSSPFKDTIVTICKNLQPNYDSLSKSNDKGLSFENFYRYLNKTITIAVEDRQTNYVFVVADIAVENTCNRVLIDSTDILRNMTAI